jgi:TRAP-type C4-dicarboxylate transport system substrate-binding protein
MKKKVPQKLIFMISFFICFSFTSQAYAEKHIIKAISAWPKNTSEVSTEYLPFIKAANEYLSEKYPGELKIQYLGGPEVIPSRDQAEAIRMGTIDMMFGTAAYYAGIAPAANVAKLSRLNTTEERMMGVDAIFDKIHRDKLNAAYLGRLGSEIQFQLYTIKPVKNLEEIKGLRIRTSAMYIDFIKSLGGIPSAIKPGDVYQALERGVVDGFMWPLYSIRPWGWHEVAKYVVGPPFYKVCHPVLANTKKWDRLPDHLRLAVLKILAEQAAIVDTESVENMKNEVGILKQAGMAVIHFSPEDEKKYLDMAYTEGWKGQLKMESEFTTQLQKLLSK